MRATQSSLDARDHGPERARSGEGRRLLAGAWCRPPHHRARRALSGLGRCRGRQGHRRHRAHRCAGLQCRAHGVRPLSGKRKVPMGAPAVTGMLMKRWERLKQKPAELDRLKLLARIELSVEQARRALHMDAAGVLRNPYALFEDDRDEYDPVSFAAVDRGLYPGTEVSSAHPLPGSCNPGLSEYDNEHRLRAATVQILEEATVAGHTLLPVGRLSEGAAGLSAVHAIPLDADIV